MSAGTDDRLRLLHVAASSGGGEHASRVAALVNHFGPQVAHTFAEAAAAPGIAAQAARGIACDELEWPALAGRAGPRRLQGLAEAMRGYDLVLTYGWGATNAVLAHTAFGPRLGLAPLIHHEHRLEPDEIDKRKLGRNLRRILAMARIRALVVPSQRLERIAIAEWKVPPGKLRRIAPGIVTADYRRRPRSDALPRVIKRPGELFLGTLAGDSAGADLPMLVRAFAALPEPWHLAIIGDTTAAESVLAEAVRLAVGHRVHLTGTVRDPGKALGLCDAFAWLGGGASFPVGLTEAMATGLAVAGVDGGDATEVVDDSNRSLLVPAGDEGALAGALAKVAGDPPLRSRLGARNVEKARTLFERSTMIDRYAGLYAEALGRDRLR